MDLENIAADIINLSKSVGEESGTNVIISDLVPCKGYLKGKVRNVYLNAKVRNVNNELRFFFIGNSIFGFNVRVA